MESHNNTKFPSVCSTPSQLVEAAKNGSSYEGHDLSYRSRMNYINSNPVAVANEYNHILDTYCSENGICEEHHCDEQLPEYRPVCGLDDTTMMQRTPHEPSGFPFLAADELW